MELIDTDVLIDFVPAAGQPVTHQRMPMTTLQEIIDAARTLSPAERLRLVDAVWDDEHPENWPALRCHESGSSRTAAGKRRPGLTRPLRSASG